MFESQMMILVVQSACYIKGDAQKAVAQAIDTQTVGTQSLHANGVQSVCCNLI